MPGRDGRAWWAALFGVAVLIGLAFHEGLVGWGAIDGASHLQFGDPLYGMNRVFPPNLFWTIERSAELAAQPWDAWIVDCWRQGQPPLWNPFNGFGAPLFANGQAGALNPFKLVLAWGAWGVPAAWFLALRHLVAAAGMLALARQLGLSPWAGALAALAFALSAWALYPFALGSMWPMFMLPWLALAGERLVARPDRRAVAWLALGLGFTGLLGHAEVALLAGLGVAIATLIRLPASPAPRHALVALLAAGTLAALLAAVAVWPFLAVAGQSASYLLDADATGRDSLRVQVSQGSAWAEVLLHLLGANADRWLNEYNACIGAAALALVPAGLFQRAVRPTALAYLAAGWLLLAVCEPTALGPALPLHSFYAVALLALGLALLAGAGLDAVLASRQRAGMSALAAVGLAGVAWLLLPGGDHLALGLRWFAAPGDLTLSIGAALAMALVLALPFRPPLAAGFVLAVVGTELVLQVRLAVPPVAPFHYPAPPLVQRLQAAPPGGRVAGAGVALMPNTNMVHGLDSVEAVEVFLPERAARFQRLLFGPAQRLFADHQMTDGFQPELLDLAGVRWLLAAEPAGARPLSVALTRDRGWVAYQLAYLNRGPDQGAAHLAGAIAREPARYPAIAHQPGVTLHENRTALPRAWIGYQADYLPPAPATAATTLARTPARWRDHVLVEATPPAGWQDQPLPAGPARVTARGPNTVTVEADAARPGWLVLAETWTPDWQATLDGHPVEVRPVDLAFRGVLLPAGHHVVAFRYAPTAVPAGAAVSVLVLGLCLALLKQTLPKT